MGTFTSVHLADDVTDGINERLPLWHCLKFVLCLQKLADLPRSPKLYRFYRWLFVMTMRFVTEEGTAFCAPAGHDERCGMAHVIVAATRTMLCQSAPMDIAHADRLRFPCKTEIRCSTTAVVVSKALWAELPFADDGQTILGNHVLPRQKCEPVQSRDASHSRERAGPCEGRFANSGQTSVIPVEVLLNLMFKALCHSARKAERRCAVRNS